MSISYWPLRWKLALCARCALTLPHWPFNLLVEAPWGVFSKELDQASLASTPVGEKKTDERTFHRLARPGPTFPGLPPRPGGRSESVVHHEVGQCLVRLECLPQFPATLKQHHSLFRFRARLFRR